MGARIWILGFLFVTAVAVSIGLIVVCAQYTNAGSGLDTSGLDFALFKNTDYALNCDNNHNCPDSVVSRMEPLGSSGVYWYNKVISSDEFCSCFSGYKIAPSTPRESAFSFGWASIALDQTSSLATGLYSYLSFMASDDSGKLWSGAWPMVGYDIFSTVAWWVHLIMAAVRPAFRQTPSLLQWITPWRYLYLGLHKGRPGLVAVAAVFLIAEWSATIGIMVRQHVASDAAPDPGYQRYDLQMSVFDAAPGATNCTADVVQGLTGLFVVPEITNSDQDITQSVVRATYLATFVFNSIAATVALLYYAFGDSEKRSQRSFVFMLIAMGIMEYWILATPALQKTFTQSVTLLHPECEVIHVTVSQHKSYFDVNEYQRAWRIFRAWVNV